MKMKVASTKRMSICVSHPLLILWDLYDAFSFQQDLNEIHGNFTQFFSFAYLLINKFFHQKILFLFNHFYFVAQLEAIFSIYLFMKLISYHFDEIFQTPRFNIADLFNFTQIFTNFSSYTLNNQQIFSRLKSFLFRRSS